MGESKLSVVISTYNREFLLSQCLQSLADQSLSKDKYEVIVVNNNSTDGTDRVAGEFAKKYHNFKVFLETQQGLSYARNRGWQEASGNYTAFIDDDARAAKDWCSLMLKAFENLIPQPDVVGGEIHPWYQVPPPGWYSDDFEIRTRGPKARYLRGENPRLSGSNMAFKRSLLEKYRGFSPRYGMSGGKLRMGEESEFFRRIMKDNPVIWYDPEIKVYHWTPASKMKLVNIFRREFEVGEAQASMQNRKIMSLLYVKKLYSFSKFVAKTPLDLYRARENRKGTAARRFKELGNRLGYLLGRVYAEENDL